MEGVIIVEVEACSASYSTSRTAKNVGVGCRSGRMPRMFKLIFDCENYVVIESVRKRKLH